MAAERSNAWSARHHGCGYAGTRRTSVRLPSPNGGFAGEERYLAPRQRRRRLVGLALLVLGLAVATIASIAIGSKEIAFDGVWHALTSPTGLEDDVVIR